MANTVLVSNLPACIDASTLEDMFTSVGNVLKARIVYDALTGKSQGRGYVEMGSPEDVQNCVLHFDGQMKSGKTLMVREDRPYLRPIQPAAAKTKRGSK